MFTLIIKKSDGTVYVTETFGSKEALDKWLAVEQSRPYWEKGFTTEIIDRTAEAKAEQDAQTLDRQTRDSEVQAKKTLFQEIKTLVQKRNRTLAETNDLIDKLCALLNKIL